MLMPFQQLRVGADVEVRNRFNREWGPGFEIAAVDEGGYLIRRQRDRAILPLRFAPEDVRPVGFEPAA